MRISVLLFLLTASASAQITTSKIGDFPPLRVRALVGTREHATGHTGYHKEMQITLKLIAEGTSTMAPIPAAEATIPRAVRRLMPFEKARVSPVPKRGWRDLSMMPSHLSLLRTIRSEALEFGDLSVTAAFGGAATRNSQPEEITQVFQLPALSSI